MTGRRRGELARGLAAFVGLAVLLGGVPAALVVGVGWPLPHEVPSVTALHGLFSGGYRPSGSFYLKVVTIVAWVAWAEVVACALTEIRAVVDGRRPWRVRFAGPLQPLVAALVASVVLALPPGGGEALAHSASLAAALSGTGTQHRKALVADDLQEARANVAAKPTVPHPGEATRRPGRVVVTVAPRDTLWGLAEQYLGDPLDWREIFELNVGKPQPGHGSLTDPSLIQPGWVLELPPRAAAHLRPEDRAEGRHGALPVRERAGKKQLPHHERPLPRSTEGHDARPKRHEVLRRPPDRSGGRRRHGAEQASSSPGSLVQLPSDAVVSTSFLAGVAAAVTLGRLRRRRAYKSLPPVARWSGRGWEPSPALAQLLRARQGRPGDDEKAEGDEEESQGWIARPLELDVSLGRLLVGRRGEEPLVIDVASGGLGLNGTGAEAVARALVADVVTRHLPGYLECVVESTLWPDLLPGVDAFPGLRSANTVEEFLREAEVEVIRRVRLFEDEELPDLPAYWEAHPEDPMPVLLLVCRRPPASLEGRLRSVLGLGRRLGIGALVIGAGAAPRTTVEVDGDGRVEISSSSESEETQFVCLGPEETTAALVAVGAARRVDDEPVAEESRVTGTTRAVDVSELPVSSSEAPVRVQLLGSLRVEAGGDEVRTGMRAKSRELLAWFCCHPDGGTAETVVEALWPEVDPGKVSQRFWNTVTSLRTRLREASGVSGLCVVERYGTRYRLVDGELEVDLWEVEQALSEASDAPQEMERMCALVRAISLYSGDLVADCDWLWAETLRGDLRSRILDALGRLAEVHEQAGADEAALQALARAIEIDAYAEELYRRQIGIQARLGRLDAVQRTFNALTARLDELGVDPDERTCLLLRELVEQGQRAQQEPRIAP